jgi:hypothetical protein
VRPSLHHAIALAALLASSAFGCSANDDVPAPQVSSVTPDQAAPGSTVVVNGSDFCQQAATSEDPLACDNMGGVVFGVEHATSVQYTDTSITVEVPGGAGTVQLAVSVAGRTSNAISFTIE